MRLEHLRHSLAVGDLVVEIVDQKRDIRDGRSGADDFQQMLHVLLLGGDEVIVGRLLDRDGDVLLWCGRDWVDGKVSEGW